MRRAVGSQRRFEGGFEDGLSLFGAAELHQDGTEGALGIEGFGMVCA